MPQDDFVPVPKMSEEAATTPTQPQATPLSVGDRVRDTVDSVNSGIGAAFHETVGFGVKTVGTLVQGGERLGRLATDAAGLTNGEPYISDQLLGEALAWNERQAQADGSRYQSKTVVGGVSQGISQFLTGFATVGAGLKAMNAFQGAGTLTKAAFTGAAADAVAFDPHAARLSDLVNEFTEQHPTLRNPITEYLASDPNDSDAEGRLKNAFEGIVAGAVLEKTLRALGATKRYLTGSRTDRAKAEAIFAKEAAELDQAAKANTPKVGFSEGEISGGTRDTPFSDPTKETGGKNPEGTPEVPKTPNVAPEGETTLKPDESVNFSKDNPNAGGAPLLPQVDKDAIRKAIEDNPTWLEQGFVNKKGTLFNFSKWDGPGSAKRVVEEVAKVLPTPPKMTFKEIEEAARETGIDVIHAENSGKIKVGDITRTVVATKMVIQSMARDVTDLARKMAAIPDGDEALVALKDTYNKNIQQLADTINFGKTLQSDAARATTAGRIRTFDELGPDELKAIAAAGGGVTSLMKIVKEQPTWVKLFNAHNQVWINALLSGPRTHIRNVISNTLNTIALPVERALGGAVTGNGAMMREGADIALGIAGAFKDSIKMAAKAMGLPQIAGAQGKRWEAIKSTGKSTLDPGNTKLANTNSAGPAISTDNFKSLQGNKGADVIVNGFGQIANIPSRFMTAEDEFFKQINYRAHVTALASASARKMGLKGQDAAEYIARRLDESMDDQGAANLYKDDGIYTVKDPEFEAALEYARRATFTTKAEQGSITNWLENGTHNHPYLKMVIPFVRTPINILKNAGIRTPVLNLLSKKYRDALTGKLGERAAADARGQMAIGAALWTSAITLATEGQVTGKGPRDPKERAALLDSGWQPYSFKVGGKFVSFEGMDPFSMFFGLAGDYADMQGHLDDKTREDVVASMTIAAAENVTSKSYLTGLTQVMEALSDPGNKIEAFMRSRVGSYVPSALQQTAGLVGQSDPYMREARTIVDAVLRRIPGFSENLPPKRNVFGGAITARQALGPDSISPFFTSTITSNKAKLELARLGHAFGAPSMKLNGVDLTQVYNAKGQDFYDRWQEKLQTYRFGRYTLKERLEALVTSPQYAKWRENEADALEADAQPRTLTEVRAIITEYRERAKQDLIRSNEFPGMAQALRAQKQIQVRAKAGTDIPEALQGLLNFNNNQ